MRGFKTVLLCAASLLVAGEEEAATAVTADAPKVLKPDDLGPGSTHVYEPTAKIIKCVDVQLDPENEEDYEYFNSNIEKTDLGDWYGKSRLIIKLIVSLLSLITLFFLYFTGNHFNSLSLKDWFTILFEVGFLGFVLISILLGGLFFIHKVV